MLARTWLAAGAAVVGSTACTTSSPPRPSAPQAGTFEPEERQEATQRASSIGLARERRWIEDARSALGASEYATARACAAEAASALLARPSVDRDEAWLELLVATGRVACEAQDGRTARAAWEEVLEIRSRTLPPDHRDLQAARLSLASTLAEQGDLDGARELQEKVVEVFARTLPATHPDLQLARLDLGATLEEHGDLPGARALYDGVLEVYASILPGDHADLQRVRGNLANVLFAQRDLAGARELQEQVLEIFSRTLPPEHPDLQRARANLANTLHDQGHLGEARALQELVLEVRARSLPAEHPSLQAVRANLALTLFSQGDLTAARVLQEQVLEIFSRTLPPEHPDLQVVRGNLARTLFVLGDLAAARSLQEQALEFLSHTLPPEHPNLQRARISLSATLVFQGELAAARALQEEVLEIDSRTLHPDSDDLQLARAHLAGTLVHQGDLAAARDLQDQVLEVYARTLPPEDFNVQTARTNLATTLFEQGHHDAARALEEEVLEIYSRTLPPEHPSVQIARGNLAGTLIAQAAAHPGKPGEKDREEAKKRFAELASAHANVATEIARAAELSSSGREAEERCSSLQDALSSALSFAGGYGVFEPDPRLGRAAFILSETTRASALVSARIARMAAPDERSAGLQKEIRSAGEELAVLVHDGGTRDEYDAVIARRDDAQRELVRIAGGSKGAMELLESPDPEVLSERLSGSDAVLAYRRYTRFEVPGGETKARPTESLCAFVLRKGAELRRIELGAVEPIEAAVRDWREALGRTQGRGVGVGRASGDMAAEARRADHLEKVVFEPVRESVGDARRLVIVLDDVLNVVPMDALPAAGPESGVPVLLGDRYEIELRGTMQEILSDAAPPPGAGLVVVVGGPDYSAQPGPASPPGPSVLLRGGAWGAGFDPLPATQEEARGILELAAQGSEARESVLLEGGDASRGSIEKLAPSARFLHLATHGWFAPESVRSWNDPEPIEKSAGQAMRLSAGERVKGSGPMLLCGLALAGANLPADAVGRFPGLVTAEEISGWDLSSCELAVLSACDTNVGERRAGQGVASLQKALHMAGARTAITSLWKVPDEATKDLMLDFYRRIWIEKKPKAQALWEAKKRLREAVDERGAARYATRDWAAWVLTGDPR